MKQKEPLTYDQFVDRVKSAEEDRDGFRTVSNIFLQPDAPDIHPLFFLPNLLPRPSCGLRLISCLLPETIFDGPNSETPGQVCSLEIDDCASPKIECNGDFDSISLKRGCLGELLVIGGAVRHLEIGGRIEDAFIESKMETLRIDEIDIDRLTISSPPCEVEPGESRIIKVTVRGQVVTTHVPWAKFFHLLCPTTPVFLFSDITPL